MDLNHGPSHLTLPSNNFTCHKDNKLFTYPKNNHKVFSYLIEYRYKQKQKIDYRQSFKNQKILINKVDSNKSKFMKIMSTAILTKKHLNK
jgi:hypothetical protein